MKKIIIFIILIIVVITIGLGYYFLVRLSTPPKLTILDPFGAPPKGGSPNCSPENRYKFNVTINSKNDFVNFIKTHDEINQRARLDGLKDESNGEVDWNKVLDLVAIKKIGSRIIYSIEYTPNYCSLMQKFTLKMTNDGYVSVYGCCGK